MVKKLVYSLVAVVMVAGLSIRAADDDRMKAIEARLAALEKENAALKAGKQEIKMDAAVQKAIDNAVARTGTGAKYGGAFLAPDQPDIKGTNLIFSGELLYWKPVQDHQDFAVIDIPSLSGANSTDFPVGNVKSLDLDWSAGFRLGLGYRLPTDGWDIMAQYTYYRSEDHKSLVDPADALHPSIWNDDAGNDQADLARARQDLRYDAVDLELGRRFKVSQTLSARLFGGFRAAWINNDQRYNYFGDSFPAITASRLGGQLNEKNHFFGYGIRLGGEGDWHLSRGFSFYGKAAGSLLVGQFDLKHFEAEDDDGNNAFTPNEVDRLIKDRITRVVPVVEIGAGVAWEKKLLGNLNLKLSAGYEFTNYFNTVRRTMFTGDNGDAQITNTTDSLGFHGLTFRVKLDF
ncbi:MAG: hypothetical protein HY291_16465 [Planctomycetes bacterium]|nr:hypothetical protein [Planctomycetota bacterium]